MNIAMFSDAYWPRVNGVTVSVESFSRTLVSEGHNVLVVCPAYPDTDIPLSFQTEYVDSNAPKTLRVPSLPAPSIVTKEDRVAKLAKWKWVFKQVDSFNPDIIHINTEVMIAELGFWYARTHNLPVVYTFHTMWEDYGPNYFPFFPVFFTKYVIRKVVTNVLRRSYRVIVPTPQIEEVVKNFKLNLKTFMLPTGIDIKLFDHSEDESLAFRKKIEEHFPDLKNKRILLFAGRIGKEKNIGFILNILSDILSKHPDVILLIVGSGPDLEYYKEEARRIGVDKNCVFTGYLSRNDLALTYSISEVFMFPSLTDTQGLVTLEAMLSGTPVVAIGALGTLTVMGGDNGGFMVKNDTVEFTAAEFTARVLDLLGNNELRQSKAKEARLHARSWSLEEITKKLITLYESTISDYTEEFGCRITPLWELITDKKLWKINQKILNERSKQNWKKMLARLSKKK